MTKTRRVSNMIVVTICSILLFLYALIRLFLLKKEIKRASRQLRALNRGLTGKKLDVCFYDRDLEELAEEINRRVDLTGKAEADRRKTEHELKQAISYISHDIRTPLTSILGYIQLLESPETTPEMRQEYIRTLKNGALRLKVLLDDFFELSVIEQTDYPLKWESVKLNRLIQEVLVGFYEKFQKRNREPEIHLPDHDVVILADPSAVRRVIENLVMNAIRHSSGNVWIRLENGASSVRLTIGNPACGLSDQDVHHLFDRFYKADRMRTGKGSGLGLPIAKSLMEKMNGSLTAEWRENCLWLTCEWRPFKERET